jgi:hypothetical protein
MLIHLDTIRKNTSRPHRSRKNIGFGLGGQPISKKISGLPRNDTRKPIFFRRIGELGKNSHQRGAVGAVLDCFSGVLSGMADCDVRLGNRKTPGGNWGIGTAVFPLAETCATCGRADRHVTICLRCFRGLCGVVWGLVWGLVGGLVGGLVVGLVVGLVGGLVVGLVVGLVTRCVGVCLSARFRSRLSGRVRMGYSVAVMPWKPPVETGGW